MATPFYDAKIGKEVHIPENKITKITIRRTGKSGAMRVRHALRGELPDGRKLFKYVSQETWERYNVPEE